LIKLFFLPNLYKPQFVYFNGLSSSSYQGKFVKPCSTNNQRP
jgi:hypothetical protein